jgi:hypothetical protein
MGGSFIRSVGGEAWLSRRRKPWTALSTAFGSCPESIRDESHKTDTDNMRTLPYRLYREYNEEKRRRLSFRHPQLVEGPRSVFRHPDEGRTSSPQRTFVSAAAAFF